MRYVRRAARWYVIFILVCVGLLCAACQLLAEGDQFYAGRGGC